MQITTHKKQRCTSFFATPQKGIAMAMTSQILGGVLAHVENVMNSLATEAIENIERIE